MIEALIEDVFTLEELSLLEDMTDPILNHTRTDGPVQTTKVAKLHKRIKMALRRAEYHHRIKYGEKGEG